MVDSILSLVNCVSGNTVWKTFEGLGSDTRQKVRSFRSAFGTQLGGPAGGATGHSEATGGPPRPFGAVPT